ncbi:hypothetical protein BZG36_05020, partial [Bifiguratus adelaidae]
MDKLVGISRPGKRDLGALDLEEFVKVRLDALLLCFRAYLSELRQQGYFDPHARPLLRHDKGANETKSGSDSTTASSPEERTTFRERSASFSGQMLNATVQATAAKLNMVYAALDKLDLELYARVDNAIEVLEERYNQYLSQLSMDTLPPVYQKSLAILEKLNLALRNWEENFPTSLDLKQSLYTASITPFSSASTSAQATSTSISTNLTSTLNRQHIESQYIDPLIDATLLKIEEMDTRIIEALETAITLRKNMENGLTKAVETATQAYYSAHDRMEDIRNAAVVGVKRLLHYHELPKDWQYNEYILTGYRFLPTIKSCIASLFYLHNETGNIYTHLLASVVFIAIGIYECFLSPSVSHLPTFDRIVFGLFFIAACKCLICSTVWHTCAGISDYITYKRVACLDYIGISLLICASLVVTEYYGFYCADTWRNTYMSGTGLLAVLGVIVPWMEWFDAKEMKWLRVLFFLTIGFSGVLPVFHLILTHGVGPVLTWMIPVFVSVICYLSGVVFYGNQLPERWAPGVFDQWGHSHQLWHLFVVAGIWWHYRAMRGFAQHIASVSEVAGCEYLAGFTSMKFGKLILRTQIPEWSRYYLDYKGLKQRVKRCVGKDAAGISESQDENDVENEVTAFFFALDRELEKINDFYTLKLAEIKRRLWIFAEKFGRSTPSETISANGTPLSPLSPSSSQALKSRKRRSSLLSGPLSDSGSPLHSRQSSMNEDSDKCDGIAAHQQEQLFMALAETRVQVGKLRAFTEMNAKGVGKILKKFDKRTQSMTRQVYLTQKLEPLAFASSASLRALELYVKDWMKDVETELRGFRSSNALGRELSTIESDERRELDETNERNRARMAKRQELNSILGSDNLEAFQDWQQRGARTKAGRYLQLRQACYYQAYKIIEHLIEAGPVLLDPEDVNERSILHLLALHGGRLPKLYLDTTEEEARVFQTMEDAQRGLLKVHNIVFPVGVTTGASTEKRPIKANNSNEDTALLEFILSKLPPQTRIAQQDINGCTPIHVAVLQGYPNTARILLRHARTRSHEYDTNPVSGVTFLDECWLDKDVRSPLFCAVSRTREDGGNIECLEAICQEAGLLEWPHRDEAESQSISELLQMHLLIGCQFNVAPAVRYLVHSTQARCDILDESGETALMAACQAGATECVAEVLAGRGGMDVLNHQEPEEGWTALFMAASDGKRDIVQLLIDAKADVSLKDEAGWTAHDHAVFRGYMDTAAVIKPFIDPYVPPVAAENRQKGDTKEKDHSDASSPHLPVQDARRVYGHQYLEEECLIVLTVGSNDIRRQGTFLTIDTSHLGSGYSGPYTISVKAINATGETAIVDVPAQVTSEA